MAYLVAKALLLSVLVRLLPRLPLNRWIVGCTASLVSAPDHNVQNAQTPLQPSYEYDQTLPPQITPDAYGTIRYEIFSFISFAAKISFNNLGGDGKSSCDSTLSFNMLAMYCCKVVTVPRCYKHTPHEERAFLSGSFFSHTTQKD